MPELRKSGIDVLGEIPWGSHFCSFYETKLDLLDILVPYFKAGLESKEFCMWVVSNSDLITVEEAKQALEQAVPNLNRHISEGNIEIFKENDWYLKENEFNLERMSKAWDTKLKRALALGYEGMRVSGDTFWLEENDWKDFTAYEKQLNDSIIGKLMTVLCTYPMSKSGAAEVLEVVHAHQFAIARRQGEWAVIETPELIQAKAEIKKLNEELEQRVAERTKELASANIELRREIAERKQAEDALRKSEDRLRLVIDTVPALIHTGLPDGQLDFFNQRWLDFVGLSLEDLSGWKWTAAIHPEDVAAMVERWRTALATGEPYEHEARVRRADGEYRWLVHRKTPLRDEHGNILKWYASSIDIEDRKRAEDALRQSEDRIRLIIDTIPTMAWSMRPDGTVDFLNQRWLDYSGLSLEQYIKDPTGSIHPEDITRVMEKWPSKMADGKAYVDEMRLRRTDGEYRWFLVRTAPLHDEQGNLVKWYGVSIDIDDSKRAEEQIKQSEAHLAEAQRLAKMGSWDYDIKTDRLTWSEELYNVFGTDKRTFRETHDSFLSLIDEEDKEFALQTSRHTQQTGEPFTIEYHITTPKGEKRIIQEHGYGQTDDNGKVVRLFGTAQDITERKKAEETLRQSYEEIRRLTEHLQKIREEERIYIAREIHDELGQQLTAVKMDVAWIDKKTSEEATDIKRKLKNIIGLLDGSNQSIRRILSELRPRILDDHGLLEAIEWLSGQFTETTGIPVKFTTKERNIKVSEQIATSIFRVCQEAYTNITRYSQAKNVSNSIKIIDETIMLVIQDDGIGFDAESIQNKKSFGILGMKERVLSLGGKFELFSSPGKGTTITVSMPYR